MAKVASAKRHAQAIYELALEKNELDVWRENLKRINEALKDQKLMSVLVTPKIPFEIKKQLIQVSLPEISVLVLNFMYFLTIKGRLAIFNQILTEYEKLVDAHYGIEHVEVITPFPMDEAESTILGDKLANLLGKKKVILDTRVDPEIIGGMIARIGDKLIDGSTRRKLESLKRSLQSGISIA